MDDTTSRIGTLAIEATELFTAAVTRVPEQDWDQPPNLEAPSLPTGCATTRPRGCTS
jgi:hypothetical protein